jgi:hypothetical protein
LSLIGIHRRYSDVTTHVIFDHLDFIAKRAALVPKPSVNMTGFHGVFAPKSKYRTKVTPFKWSRGNPAQSQGDKTPE